MRGEDGVEWHDIARYFTVGTSTGTVHHLQCTCGDKFDDVTEKAVMRKHFQHGVLKMRRGEVPQ